MNKSRFFFIPLLFLITIQALVSQQAKSQLLEKKLINDGFNTSRQLLSGSVSAQFPYNILFSLPDTNDFPLHRLFIVISQEDALLYYPDVKSFLLNFLTKNPSYPVDIVFTANDDSPHPALKDSLAGIRTYTQNLDTTSYTSAIVLDIDNTIVNTDAVLHIGMKNRIAPLDLVEPFLESLSHEGVSSVIKGNFNSLYRLGFVSVHPVLSELLSQEIPSLALIVNPQSLHKTTESLIYYTRNYDALNHDNWDNQYTHFTLFDKSFFISEYVLMLIIIFVSGITLLLLSTLSFMIGKKNLLRKEELKRTWYLLPIIVGITSIFLSLAQPITFLLFPSWSFNAITAFIIKISIGVVFLSFVSLAQYLFSFPLTSFIYGYLLSITAFINIFIFTTADISLFIPFSIAYLIVYASRGVKKKRSLFLSALAMTFPFLPYLIFTDSETRNALLHAAVNSSFIGNILFAFFAVPFEIMWIRIMVRMKLFGRQKGVSLKQIFIELGGTITIVIVIAISVSVIRNKEMTIHIDKSKQNIIQTSPYTYIQTETSQSVLFDKINTEIIFKSKLPVFRYEISIKSQSQLPIYDANYPYDSLTQEGWAVFSLDDYPPNPLLLRFSSRSGQNLEVITTAYLQNGTIVIEEEKHMILSKEL